MFRSNSHQVLPGWWCNGNIGLHNPHEKPHHGLLQCFAMAHNSCQPHHHLWPPQLYKWSLEHPQCSFVGAAHDQPVSWPFIEHTKCCKTTYFACSQSVIDILSFSVMQRLHAWNNYSFSPPAIFLTLYVCLWALPRNLFGDPSMFPCGDYSSNLKNLQSRCPAPYSKCPTFQSAQRKHASL